MSFLDNLENSLKTLESRDETSQRDREENTKREAERQLAWAASPYAEQLRSGPFVPGLLDEAIRIGHGMRTKVHMAWMGTTLRLEARDRKLELRPTGDGILAVFLEGNQEARSEKLDLGSDAKALAREWLNPAG